MHYFVYLDEFGHDGRYISREDKRFKTSPIFGLGGFALPVVRIRGFATWFYQLKCHLLDWEIKQTREHPAKWEKKGSALYTIENIEKYPELRQATNRLINKIKREDGFIFYQGLEKYNPKFGHNSKSPYKTTLSKSLRKLDEAFRRERDTFTLMLDEHQIRAEIVEAASKTMFGEEGVISLIEPPIQAESHLFQTLQCADWICGLLGRLGAYRVRPDEYKDFASADKYFGQRIDSAAQFSTIEKNRPKKKPHLDMTTVPEPSR